MKNIQNKSIQNKGLATRYDLSTIGKSFLIFDLLFAVFKAEEWFRMQTKQSKAAYIHFE